MREQVTALSSRFIAQTNIDIHWPGWLGRQLRWRFALAALGSLLLAWAAVADEPTTSSSSACGKVGTWLDPMTGEAIDPAPLMAALSRRSVVLLG